MKKNSLKSLRSRSTSAHREHKKQGYNILLVENNIPANQKCAGNYKKSIVVKLLTVITIAHRFQSSYIFLLHEPKHLIHAKIFGLGSCFKFKSKKSFKTFQINHRTITSLQREILKYINQNWFRRQNWLLSIFVCCKGPFPAVPSKNIFQKCLLIFILFHSN